MSDALEQRVAAWLDAPVAAPVAAPVKALAARFGEEAGAVAVLFYGSNLRTGSLEGVLDYYVLLSGRAERGLWPRVTYREIEHEAQRLRAKVATMTLATFREAALGQRTDTTIWARFVQPSALVWLGPEQERAQIESAIAGAVATAARLAAAMGPAKGTERAYWQALFDATYRAEFRIEPPGRSAEIVRANAAHFDGLLPLALARTGIVFERRGEELAVHLPDADRQAILAWWRPRQRMGKALNLVRLTRALWTFRGALGYGLWKFRRHRSRQG